MSIRAAVVAALAVAGGLGAPVPTAAAAPTSASAQVATARSRSTVNLRQAHPGQPEALTHPDADHAGSEVALHAAGRASTPKPAVQAGSSPLSGIDVASYQGNVAWSQVAAQGASFAYAKASEGTYYTNPYFAEQYQGAYANGLVRGAYHFAIPNGSTGAAQADYFVSSGGGWTPDNQTLPGALDIEYDPYGPTCYGLTPAQMVSWVTSFVDEYHTITGRWAVIYSTTDWWSTCTDNYSGFAGEDPLWIANFGPSPSPLPAGWSTYTFWQDADSGSLPGDQDLFNGPPARLLALANGDQSAPPPSPAGSYHPLGPTRVTDTRAGSGFANSGIPLGPNGAVTVTLPPSVPSTATAVALSVTAVDGTSAGFLSVYPTGVPPSTPTSVLDYVAGPPGCSTIDCVVSNLVLSRIAAGRVTVANGGSAGTTDVVVDLEGYVDPTSATTSGAGHYYPLGPSRVVDTRCVAGPQPSFCAGENLPAANATPALGDGQSLEVPFTGLAPGPGASAVVVQITAADTTTAGYLTAYPSGQVRPTTSDVNFVAGQSASTRAIVPVGPDGRITLYNAAGITDVAVDVVGVFSDGTGSPSGGSLFTPITPARLVDTRTTGQPLGNNQGGPLQVAGFAGIPAEANGSPTAAALNVTEAASTTGGFLTVTPAPLTAPATTSDVNFEPGEIRANADLAALSPAGGVSAYNLAGVTQVVIDASGYFSAA